MTTIKYHTKEDAIQAVTQDGYALRFYTPELQDNEGVVWEAIKQERWALRFASKRLTSNKAFIMKALNEGVYPKSLVRYADATLQSEQAYLNQLEQERQAELVSGGSTEEDTVVW